MFQQWLLLVGQISQEQPDLPAFNEESPDLVLC